MTEMTTNVSDLSRVRCCDREPCKLATHDRRVAKACAAECSSADTCAKAGTLSLSTEYLVFCWAHGLGGFTGVVLLTSTDML